MPAQKSVSSIDTLAKKLLTGAVSMLLLSLSGFWIAYGLSTIIRDHLVDFVAFHGAGKNILGGLSPYDFYPTAFGASTFQSPLWLGWLFVPLAILPIDQAFVVFGVVGCGLLLVCLRVVLGWQGAKLSPLNFFYLYGCALVLSYHTIGFGQVTILQLTAVVMVIAALHSHRPVVAGLIMPLVLIKPHLVLFFLVAALQRGGRRMLLAGIGSTLLLALAAFLSQPSWLADMLRIVVVGQLKSQMEWAKFATLTGMFSLPPWLGALVLLLSLPILLWLDKRFRSLPVAIWLSIALVLSLVTAPYAFAYDLPLLLPALVWLCLPWSERSIILVFAVAYVAILAGFTGISYAAMLAIAILAVGRAMIQPRIHE